MPRSPLVGRSPAGGRAFRVAVAALLAALGAAVLGGFTVSKVSDAADADAVRTQALAAARQIAVDFASYDYKTIAQDFKRVADQTTGSAHQQWLTSSTGAADLISKTKTVSKGEVVSAAVVSSSAARVTVLVAVTGTIQNVEQRQPLTRGFGLEMVLVDRDGRWLASELTPV